MKFFIIFGIIKWIDMFVPRFVASNPLKGLEKNNVTVFFYVKVKDIMRLNILDCYSIMEFWCVFWY